MSSTQRERPEDPWDAVTFEGARRAQAREFRELSSEDRFRWLCEMSELIAEQARQAGRTPPALDPERWG